MTRTDGQDHPLLLGVAGGTGSGKTTVARRVLEDVGKTRIVLLEMDSYYRDIDWETEAPRYRDRIFDYLEKHHIPDLRKRLVTSHMLTPHGFRDDLNSHLGSAFSVEPILTQSAWFRPHNRDDVIRNLYIVGAGTHPGAGIPGVVGSAKATAGLMIEHACAEAPA